VKFGLAGLLDRLTMLRARYPGYRDRDGVVPVKPVLFVDVKYFGRISRDGNKVPGGSLRDGVMVWFDIEDPAARHRRIGAAARCWSCDQPEVVEAMDAAPDVEPPPRALRPPPVDSKILVSAAETAVSSDGIQRVLHDAVVPSREQLVAHWRAVGDFALEYLARRPLTLVRHVGGLTFFHEGAAPFLAPGVRQMTYKKRRDGSTGYRVWIDDPAGLLGLVEMGVVEVHPWGTTMDDIEHPDMLVLDLDPDPNLESDFVVETALKLRDIFEENDLATWPKLTGGKGIHVVAPIEPRLTWEEGRAFIRSIAERLAATAPKRYTLSSPLTQRPGRIYLDYARNGLGATAVGCYSPRARPGVPVAMPVTWNDIERRMRPNSFSLARNQAVAMKPSIDRRQTRARSAG
jgi:DNA ligase D